MCWHRKQISHPVIVRNAGFVHLYAQPAHIIVESFCEKTGNWVLAKEVNLPRFEKDAPHCIELNNVETDMIRVICDKEHLVQRTHAEYFSSPDTISIHTLKKVEIWGEELTSAYIPDYIEPMTRVEINPCEIPNVDITVRKYEIIYSSKFFKVTFSLRKPIMTYLSYDCLGQGNTDRNVLESGSVWINGSSICGNDMNCAITGPRFLNAKYNVNGMQFTGDVYVKDDYVLYKNVRFNDSFSMDIKFIINEKGMQISIEKECYQDYEAIEADDFRFLLCNRHQQSGILGMPDDHMCRVGTIKLPATLCSPGLGSLDIVGLDGRQHALQVDDFRDQGFKYWFAPIVGGKRDEYGFIHFKKGKSTISFAMTIGGVLLECNEKQDYDTIHPGFKKGLTAALGFRADSCGFSNNFQSGGAHISIYFLADMIPYFRRTNSGLDMAELLRFTVECVLRNGPGYGDCKELFLDTDPSILISVARVYQLLCDKQWIVKYWNRIKESIYRMRDNMDENGLIKSRELTGNSGSNKWSSNFWDVIGYGNYDAYSNALGYRALKNAIVLADVAGDAETREICREMADSIYCNYERMFIHPDSGLVSGWVSADGQHHDYMFPQINGMAICFGLISQERSRMILRSFWNKFKEMGLDYFDFGLPLNLIPVRKEDAPESDGPMRDDGKDTFEFYQNGALTPIVAFFFVRALYMCGMEKEAEIIGDDLLESFGRDTFYGGGFDGKELFTWQGQCCGYEAYLDAEFPVLAEIAVQKGIVDRIEEEWWLEENVDR